MTVIATQLNMRIRATGTPRTTSSAFPLEIQQKLSPRIKKLKKPLSDFKYKTEDKGIGLSEVSPISILK